MPMQPDAPAQASSPVILALVLALAVGLGAAAGAGFGVRWAGGVAVGGDGPAPIQAAPAAADPELTAAIARLSERIEELGARLDRPATRVAVAEAGEGDRSAVSTAIPDPSLAEFFERLDAWTRSLEAVAERLAGPGTAGVVLPEVEADQLALSGLVGRSEEELSLDHAFWSVQRLIETYGRPSEITDRWIHYRVPIGGQRLVIFGFRMHETGFIVRVSVTLVD